MLLTNVSFLDKVHIFQICKKAIFSILKKEETNGYKLFKPGTKVLVIIANSFRALVREYSNTTNYSFALNESDLSKEPIIRGHPLTTIFKDDVLEKKIEEVVKEIPKKKVLTTLKKYNCENPAYDYENSRYTPGWNISVKTAYV